jgi:hypothetical protein
MASKSLNRTFRGLVAAAAFGCALAAVSPEARADGPVSATGKGIVGGALLGGEVVMLTIGAFGVEEAWPYLVFGGLGMAAGGAGGFVVEDQVSDAEPSLYLLAGGMALVIPTLVVVLNNTTYKPKYEDEKKDDGPTANPPAPGTTPAGPAAPAPAASGSISTSKAEPPPRVRTRMAPVAAVTPHIPLSIVDVNQGQLALGMPAVEVRPIYSKRELSTFGVEQKNEVRIPVFKAAF